MKKSFVLFIIVSFFTSCSKAQHEGVIYTDFKPDLRIAWNSHDTIQLDFDQDGVYDLRLYYSYWGHDLMRIQEPLNGFDIRVIQDGETDIYPTDPYAWFHAGYHPFGWQNENGEHYIELSMAVRKVVNTSAYYGWYRVYAIDSSYFTNNPYNPFEDKQWMYIDKMAFCTIPDYPLAWGQTTITRTDRIGNSSAFATLHPNPTTGLVAIAGEKLKAAEAFNALGQRVATATGKGELLQIDLSGLPAGLYFVSITDEDGRKCVRKVVKE